MSAVGEKIRGMRERLSISQGSLSRTAGVSQGYLSQIETGSVKNISLSIAFKLVDALGVKIEDLLTETYTEANILPELEKKLSRMSYGKQQALLEFLKAVERFK